MRVLENNCITCLPQENVCVKVGLEQTGDEQNDLVREKRSFELTSRDEVRLKWRVVWWRRANVLIMINIYMINYQIIIGFQQSSIKLKNPLSIRIIQAFSIIFDGQERNFGFLRVTTLQLSHQFHLFRVLKNALIFLFPRLLFWLWRIFTFQDLYGMMDSLTSESDGLGYQFIFLPLHFIGFF